MANTLPHDDLAVQRDHGRHLDEAEMVAAIEGDLAPARIAHVDTCRECRDTVEGLRGVAASAAAVEVPEPSPLFWAHFSSRVRDAVAEPAPSAGLGEWLRRPAVAGLLAATAVLLAVVIGRGPSSDSVHLSTQSPVSSLNPSSANGYADAAGKPVHPDNLDNADSDEAWALVRAVADDVAWDDTHDAVIGARPGAVDGMAMELTAAEQRELARLLHDELRRSGA